MDPFKEQVKKSFSACRTDIESLKEENKVLLDKVAVLEKNNSDYLSQIVELKTEIKNLTNSFIDIKDAISKSYDILNSNSGKIESMENSFVKKSDFDDLKKEFVNKNVDVIESSNNAVTSVNTVNSSNSVSYEHLLEEKSEVKKDKNLVSKDPYEALLAFKAKANKREVLKQKILSMISESGMNLSELKFMFVEHFRYCSKATFYNYLKELELERSIKIERENSRNIVFLSGVRKEV